jgi:hypothetical protein
MWCGNFAEGEGGARYARSFRLATKFLHHRRAVEFLRSLLDLAFLVDHVLADDGIVLLDLHLAGVFFLFLSVV